MIITLTSDLGRNSPYIGIAEAIISERLPQARLVHISHTLTPFKVLENAYFLKCTVGQYPAATYHVMLSDLVMDLPASILACKHGDNHYLGVDNGILTAGFSATSNAFFLYSKVSATFREWMIQLCDAIHSLVEIPLTDNPHFLEYMPKKLYEFPKVVWRESELECVVIAIDNYGNCITNLDQNEFQMIQRGRKYKIKFLRNEAIDNISDRYMASDYGGIAAYFNEFGFLQISMKDKNSNSASMLGLTTFHGESLINNSIHIYFED